MGKRKFSGNKSSAQGRPEGTHKVLKHMNADFSIYACYRQRERCYA